MFPFTNKERREAKKFQEGYDYAAGELLKGNNKPSDLIMQAYGPDRDAFDDGIEQAVADWNRHIAMYRDPVIDIDRHLGQDWVRNLARALK